MSKKFYGEKEVVDVISDNIYATLKFADGTETVIAASEIATLVNDQPINLTALRTLRCTPVVAGILMLMKNYNIRQDEIDFVLRMTVESVNKNYEEAMNKLWGVQAPGEQTFLEVDKVLKS